MALLSPSTSLSSSSSSSYLSNGLPSSLLISKPRNRNLKFFRNSSSSSAFTTKASWQELAGVLVFSAIPFTAVEAIANSSIGAALQSRLQETKKVAVQNSAKFNALAEKAREESALGGCRPSQVQIYQGSTGFGPGHVPKFTVNIINESLESKVFYDIHVACGDFASTTLINPKIFRRLAPGDCLVKDEKEFNPGEIIAFDYTNLFSYKLVPSQVKC